MRNKRIVFVVNVDWFFISHRLPIALEAQNQGYEVHLICGVTGRQNELENLGIKVHSIEISRSGANPILEFKTILYIWRILKELRPALVHCVTIKAVIYGGIVSRMIGINTQVYSISGLGYVFIQKKMKSFVLKAFAVALFKIALKRAHKVIFQNKADLSFFVCRKIIQPEQAELIRGSGVDLTQYSVVEEPKGEIVVSFIGRLLIDKGVGEFVDAARILFSSGSGLRMVLVGDIDEGNPNSVTRAAVDSWIHAGIVEYLGFQEDIASLISRSNIIVLPSYREGLPKALIEAAACGRSVVTTDVPGCRDAIEPGKTGLLVPIKDPSSLAKAISALAMDDELRKEFSKNARRLAEDAFSIEDVIIKHMVIYGIGR